MSTSVLMFGWEFPPHNSGGLGVACAGIVRSLAKRGQQITFVLPRRLPIDTPYASIVFADVPDTVTGVAVRSALTPYATHQTYADLLKGTPTIYGPNLIDEVYRYAASVRPILTNRHFDVIYAHDWLSFPAGLVAKKLTSLPFIAHIHSTEYDRCGGGHGVNRDVYAIEKRGMEEADRVIAVSQYMKNIIVRFYNIPAEKIDVVHNGIDDDTTPQGKQGRSQLLALKEADYSLVLFLGRITLQKGLDHLLRAAERVVAHNPKVLFIVSGSGDMERRMMEFAAELGIARNVLFAGFLRGSEQHEAYRLADLFVMPSVSEPFGIAALEAMKLGTPVIVSKQSGVAEAVQHALKVDFWDRDELANKILSSIAHPIMRSTMKENGSHEVHGLTWDKTGGAIDVILNRVIREHASDVTLSV